MTVTLFSGQEHERARAPIAGIYLRAESACSIAADLAVGEVASLNFALPSLPEPWDVRAVLRCRRGYQYGFEFLSLSEQQSKTLAGYFPTLERSDSDFEQGTFQPKRGAPRTM